jgi:molecular chaperone GrpE
MGESNIRGYELSKTTKQKKQEQIQAETGEVEQPDATGKPEAGEQTPEEDAIDVLQVAREEIAELEDKLLRAHAEMDNLRKRSQRDVADAHKFGVEKFATALLDVVDNLERALDVEQGNEAGLREGVRLTLDSWHGMMKKFEVERIDAVGETFDPHRHEALSQMPSDEPEGTVIGQHVAGYTLHGRLIRPAKVLVSGGPAKSESQK